jgi:hypothetical protein
MSPRRHVALTALSILAALPARAQRAPILDMHLHAKAAAAYGATGLPLCAPMARIPTWDPRTNLDSALTAAPPCARPLVSPRTDAEVRDGTIARMTRHNIYGVLGGTPAMVTAWQQAAPGRFLRGLDLKFDAATGQAFASEPAGAPPHPMPPDSVRALVAAGQVQVLAEVANQYAGIAPDDMRLDPYFAIAEEFDIPVGVHVDGGGPGAPYNGTPGFRARLQSAFTLEEVLVRHPKLRLYIMHGGFPLIEPLEALLLAHPQVHLELAYIASVEPRAAYYRFLKRLVEDGFEDRILFGSDQMIWPGMIDEAVRALEQAPFLTAAQKRKIFYGNAARFLRLPPAEVARHYGRVPPATSRRAP